MTVHEIEDQAITFVDYLLKFSGAEIFSTLFDTWAASKDFQDEDEKAIWEKVQDMLSC